LIGEKNLHLSLPILSQIAQNQEVSTQAKLFLRFDDTFSSISGNNLCKFLNDVSEQLKNGLKLKDSHVEKLTLIQFSLHSNKDLSNITNFANIYS
jgi:primosomal protein N''